MGGGGDLAALSKRRPDADAEFSGPGCVGWEGTECDGRKARLREKEGRVGRWMHCHGASVCK